VIALVGASGTLGRLVRASLETRGERVVAITRLDARKSSAIRRIGADVIIDCAGASTAMALGRGWRGFAAVDTPIGLAAVEAAEQTGARMIYVATCFAPAQRRTPYVDAHVRVIAAMHGRLRDRGVVVRSTGFFSAYAALIPMARRGLLVDIGDGRARTNLIDERDLAEIVAAHVGGGDTELAVGPEIMSRREIYEHVAALAKRRVRMFDVPVWLARIGTTLLAPLHPRISQFGRFACGLARHDVVAEPIGTRRLDAYLSAMLRQWRCGSAGASEMATGKAVGKKRASKTRVARQVRPAKQTKERKRLHESGCVIPSPVPSSALGRVKVRLDPEPEQRHVREYIGSQAPRETVVHLEKVASERVFDRKHDVWDVHTKKGRWWVITNPTNLYSQEHFPSLDYVLSFHIGLGARIAARAQKDASASDAERERILSPWRRWEQAFEALDVAEEAEDFQAIGMRCRECLIELTQAAADASMVARDEEVPKRSDFIHWSEIIARAIASGSSAEEVRGYLRTTAKTCWQLVNWLTHAKNAVRADAHFALDATSHTLVVFGTAVLRHEQGVPDRCPGCSSYQVGLDFRPDLSSDRPYVSLCAKCGWSAPAKNA
jgi:uncharacterized protein YbjT (DUF2867 family)